MTDSPANAKRRRRLLYREPGSLTAREWAAIRERYNQCCAYCGTSGPLEKDHIVPISKGGTHTRDNVVPACPRCNRAKADKDVDAWTAEQARIRAHNLSRREKRRKLRNVRKEHAP